jgi:hypothetical protein
VYRLTRTDDDEEGVRERIAYLQKLTDAELIARGRSAAFMASRSKRETWRVQLGECRAEWRRRHPAGSNI